MSSLWHDLRSKNIGGSEVSDLFGEGYGTLFKLWHIKKGNIQPDDLSDDEHIASGNWLEQGIMDWANHKWGTNFKNPQSYYQHPTQRGMGCTPDGIDDDIKAMAQIKIVSESEFKKRWKCTGDEISEAPAKFILQVQHEMECASYGESHLIVMVVGFSRRLCRMIVYRDEALIRGIKDEIAFFWKTIDENDPPEPNFEEDGAVVQEVRKLLPYHDLIDMTGNNFLQDAAERYLAAKIEADQAETAKKAASTEIQQIVGNTKKVLCGDIEISTIENSGSPGKVVTPDMVGQTIGARKGFSYPKITRKTITF